MEIIRWTDKLSVGVSEIDEQHKRWISIYNKLYESMTSGKPREKLKEVLKELTDYTHYHFGTEEMYFRRYGYGKADEHEKAHLIFTGNIMGFQKDFENSRTGLSDQLLEFLKDWLINHILYADKAYTKCFHEHGLR